MFHKPTKDSVRVAIIQVVIIVFGVLGTGATQHWWALLKKPVPAFQQWVMDWGLVLFILPLGWILWYLRVLRREGTSEELKRLAFQVGLMLAVMLVFLFVASSMAVFGEYQSIDIERRVDEL